MPQDLMEQFLKSMESFTEARNRFKKHRIVLEDTESFEKTWNGAIKRVTKSFFVI